MARESESAHIAGDIACNVLFSEVESWICKRLLRRSSIKIESAVDVMDILIIEQVANAILEGSGAPLTRITVKRLVEQSSINSVMCPNKLLSRYVAEAMWLLWTDLL